jgi:G:T/U-mismatch repair DNA glycosylase
MIFKSLSKTTSIENYGFINAAKLLKCTPNTKAEALHDKHYPQVLSALSEFEVEQKNIINQSNNKLLSTTEKKAINILKAFKNANADEKAKLKQAIEQIENKRFQSLVTKINKLKKNSKGIKPLVVLERLLNIINKYDVNSHIEVISIGSSSSEKLNFSFKKLKYFSLL